jgi:hypothetical protein
MLENGGVGNSGRGSVWCCTSILVTEGGIKHRCKLKRLYLKVPAGRIADVDKSQLRPEFKERMKNGEFVNGVAIEKG